MGNAFADAIEELNLAADFTDHGYETDVVADLRAEAQDVIDAEEGRAARCKSRAVPPPLCPACCARDVMR